jgi:hypothetical protein
MTQRITTKDLHTMARAYVDALISAGVYPEGTGVGITEGSVTYGRGYGFQVEFNDGKRERMAGTNSYDHLPCGDARKVADNYNALRAMLAGVQAVAS